MMMMMMMMMTMVMMVMTVLAVMVVSLRIAQDRSPGVWVIGSWSREAPSLHRGPFLALQEETVSSRLELANLH